MGQEHEDWIKKVRDEVDQAHREMDKTLEEIARLNKAVEEADMVTDMSSSAATVQEDPNIVYGSLSVTALSNLNTGNPECPRIVAAAVKISGLTISLPKPARHHDVINTLANMFYRDNEAYFIVPPEMQGFLDSDGHFLNRKEAMLIAYAAGQTKVTDRDELYSEDLW